MVNVRDMRIGVVSGGPSSEHEVSLNTGEAIVRTLRDVHPTESILIDREGSWQRKGKLVTPQEATGSVNVIVNALHGEYGEDGKVQQVFEWLQIPYTGSGVLASALAMNKKKTRDMCAEIGVKQPVYRAVRADEMSDELVEELFTTFPHPCVVKPNELGSSVGVSIVQTKQELKEALEHVFTLSETALLEEYIKGKEATCGVIENFRGDELYALPLVEIRPTKEFFDYEAKYDGSTEEIVPGNFTEAERDEIQDFSKRIHRLLGLRHYSRSDFIVHPKRGVYLLEVNTLPGMTEESLFPKSLDAIGSSLQEFLEHIIDQAINSPKRETK